MAQISLPPEILCDVRMLAQQPRREIGEDKRREEEKGDGEAVDNDGDEDDEGDDREDLGLGIGVGWDLVGGLWRKEK
jgi:hypothetical protein